MSVENKHADGGRDGQTCLARPNYQARTGIQAECGDFARCRGIGLPNLFCETKFLGANGDPG